MTNDISVMLRKVSLGVAAVAAASTAFPAASSAQTLRNSYVSETGDDAGQLHQGRAV